MPNKEANELIAMTKYLVSEIILMIRSRNPNPLNINILPRVCSDNIHALITSSRQTWCLRHHPLHEYI